MPDRETVTLTETDILAAQLGSSRMIAKIEEGTTKTLLRDIALALTEAGVKVNRAVIDRLSAGVVEARQKEKIEEFAFGMATLTNHSNMFAKLEYGSGMVVGIGLVFGEGKLLDGVSKAFSDHVGDDSEEEDNNEGENDAEWDDE